MSLTTFLQVHSNSKVVSYLSWQNVYPNLKTTCHIKLKLFLWTKLLENLLLAKYLISVIAPLKWQVKKLGFQRLRDLLNSGMKKKVFGTFCDTTIISGKKRKKVLEECQKSLKWQIINHFFKMFIWILVLWIRGTVVSEAYSEPSRTSKMELFARIANCFQPLTIS